MTKFGTLHSDGTLTDVREIRQSSLMACPHSIWVASHYREDESCKCDDPGERAMMIREWGYRKASFKNIPLRQPRRRGHAQ